MSLASEVVHGSGPLSTEIIDHELGASTPNQIDATRQIHQSKMARKSAKAVLTRKLNEINELIKDVDNAERIQSAYHEFEEATGKFLLAHKNYHAKLSDEDDLEESQAYYEAEVRRASAFEEKIKSWLNDNVHDQNLSDGNDPSNEIKPSDSVSNVDTDYVSQTSRKFKSIHSEISLNSRCSSKGSAVSAKAAAAAKKAVLKEQAIRLHRRQELQKQELFLQQQREELDLETKIAQAAAEERTYSEIGAHENANVERCDRSSKVSYAFPYQPQQVSISVPLREEHSRTNPDVPNQLVDVPKQLVDVPKQLSNNQHVWSSSLSPHADVWNKNQAIDVPTCQVDSRNNNRHVQTELDHDQRTMGYAEHQAAFQTNNPLVTPVYQQMQNMQMEQILAQQQQHTLALTLPTPKVPTFSGNPVDFHSFIQAFEQLIEQKTNNYSSRLYYLIQYTSGDVQELMRSCLSMDPEQGYQEARRLLKSRYGRNYQIATAYVDRINNYPQIKSEDGASLQRFSVLLTSCKNALKQIGYLNKIENPDSLQKIMEKLPFGLRQKWRDVADDITEVRQREITIEDIAVFVEKRARASNHPIFGRISKESRVEKPGGKTAHGGSSFATSGKDDQRPRTKLKCPSCNGEHWLSQCKDFKSKPVEDRFKFVRSLKLCDNCLTPGHMARSCQKASFCKIDGCKFKHSTFLHRKTSDPNANSQQQNEKPATEQETKSEEIGERKIGYVNVGGEQRVIRSVTGMPVLPVKVKAKGSNRTVETYAFLDGGSNTSFVTESLLKKLGVKGDQTTLSLTTMEKERSELKSSIVSLEVSDLDGQRAINLSSVFSVEKLPVSKEDIPRQSDIDRWPHLEGIAMPEIDAEVSLLIGNDVPKALQPMEIRGSDHEGPYAVKTALGWTVNGPLGRDGTQDATANFINADEKLEKLFRRFCDREFDDVDDDIALSCDDRRALSVMKETIQLKDGHYELALPWKSPPPSLPRNRPLAERRLKLLKRRLENSEELAKKYSAFMDDLLKSGYARKVPDEQREKQGETTWYLPHHPVFHPQKPDKVRVVFDCAAEYGGTSLNKELLQGPDLTNSLVGVLTRFREGPIAMMADIEAMFHQVRVRHPDCDSLRFLWWPDNDLSKEPEEYQMMVHLFGSVSSPSCANFALRQTADDNSEQFDPDTVNTVKRNFYVDDCLKSSQSEQAAVTTAEQLRLLLSKGGFRLTKWLSNSRRVIESIPESERSKLVKEIRFGELPTERALGVLWNVQSDTFGFTIAIKSKPFTRRGILSVVSSVYDPLGFAAPFILLAKEILQDLCRMNIGWDDPIPENDSKRWEAWLSELPKLQDLKITRCFKPPDFGEVVSAELHHFSDASQRGYGAVSYLRLTNAEEANHCSFVMGKSRLAPLKSITIPRLELSAAVLATKLDKSIRKEIDIPISESVFWTNSTCVLSYIASRDRRFHTFVANRVSTIHETSSPSQWKHVDTKYNPADDASRGLHVEDLLQNKRWLGGPEFLSQSKEGWPEQPSACVRVIEASDPEVKKVKTFATNATGIDIVNGIFGRFSSWYRLKRFVAWMLRYKNALRKACTSPKEREQKKPYYVKPLTVEELREAELEIVKIVQERSFPDEIAVMRQNLKSSENATVEFTPVKRSSQLCKLDPVYDKRVLRVGGRLRNSSISEEAKHPLILPGNHHVVVLIVEYYHDLSGHCGLEHVLAMLRERFWIIRARVLIKSVLRRCFDCKKRQAPVGEQKMAELPADRVTAGKPPFTNVGIDCFGPFTVKRGRSNVKRYGVLFTCLAIRAVHIEVANSLDTDSFLNALRRFVARRGQPEEIRSDNGTNFVGGNHELRKALNAWNQDKINGFLTQRNVRWIFNPPKASHHGGVWERCIRTVRKVLNALMKEQVLDDERLTTLMCEVEAIINNRPITKVSDDPQDLEALTPNHLLLLRKGPECPPGVFTSDDHYSRRKWKQVQYLADIFWKRWIKEYLPCLQERQRWSKTQRNFSVGDIVLVVDESSPRNAWPLGRVVEVRRNNKDGLVRSVKVKTKNTSLDRPVTKIVLLETVESVGKGRQ